MSEHLAYGVTVFMGLFAIMNPIANTPLFLSLTESDDATVRRAIARRALVMAFAIVFVFVVSGGLIFRAFGISLPAFQIAGGLLVALIGFQMVHGRPSAVQHPQHSPDDITGEMGVAVSPLAMPLLAGPGTIASAISFASGDLRKMVATLVAFLILCWITYFCFVYGARLVRYLGPQGMAVITRMMGLILAVIGIQMILTAVSLYFRPSS